MGASFSVLMEIRIIMIMLSGILILCGATEIMTTYMLSQHNTHAHNRHGVGTSLDMGYVMLGGFFIVVGSVSAYKLIKEDIEIKRAGHI